MWRKPDAPDDDFSYSDGDESEDWVGQTVRNASDVGRFSRELGAGIRDWPSLYHLSSSRANVIEPLIETINGPVLEIGVGMGAVTRALGERGLDVVAVEGSARRAAICADRCRDLPNVTVVADTIQGFGTEERFATVVMIGVLEYSRAFGFPSGDADPVDLMLEHVASLLAPGGQLVLAIENQFGLKYLAGYPEDHLGRRMVGVEDRYESDGAVTFGREELCARLEAAGMTEQEWYYPFPDYKLPSSVISDRALKAGAGLDVTPLVAPSWRSDRQKPATTSFELERAWRVAVRNDLVAQLANSFLVRASASALVRPSAELAWHFGSSGRRPEFQKVTTFEASADGLVVRRRRATDLTTTSIDGFEQTLVDEPYHRGVPWTEALEEIVAREGWEAPSLTEWFATWFTHLHRLVPDRPPTGDQLVPGALLDAMPWNLVMGDSDSVFIDLEWSAGGEVPLSYIAFRAAYYSLTSLGPVAAPSPKTSLALGALVTAMLDGCGLALDEETLVAHWRREQAFQSAVLGSSAPLRPSIREALAPELNVRRTLDAVVADADALAGVAASVEQFSLTERELREEIERRGGEISRLRESERDLAARNNDLDAHNRDLEAAERGLSARFEAAQSELAQLAETAAKMRAEHEATVGLLNADLDTAREEWRVLERVVLALQATVSWRVTRPLRGARRAASWAKRRAEHQLRRAAGRASGPVPGTPADIPASPGAAEGHSHPRTGAQPLDIAYYRARNPDLQRLSDADLHRHFETFGRGEGRHGVPVLRTSRTVIRSIDPDRETVLVLFHDATRTGAPVLGWNLTRELGKTHNVVAVLLRGGELASGLEGLASATVTLDTSRPLDPLEARLLAEGLTEQFEPVYAIANSAATHPLASALEHAGTPVVGLVHEFCSSMRPVGVLKDFFESISTVVFPAEIVAASMKREYVTVLGRNYEVIPQGKSVLPPAGTTREQPHVTRRRGTDDSDVELPEESLEDFLAGLAPETVLVLGAGTIAPRKGIEFFVQAAAKAHEKAPDAPLVFAWIGERVPGLEWYVEELWEQVDRSGAKDRVAFIAPAPDLAELYERADLFLLSSRLDPFPNVTIDAALGGIPVVAFRNASGFADWLDSDPQLGRLVVGHLDAAEAADRIAELAEDASARAHLGEVLRAHAEETFDLARYVARVDALGHAARATAGQKSRDLLDIAASGKFAPHLFGATGDDVEPESLITVYLNGSRIAAPRKRARAGLVVRRPTEGFNPLVYAEQAPDYDEARDGDPFADYLRRGEPDGPWKHPVIRPTDSDPPQRDVPSLAVLVHGHFYYPELFPNLLPRLAGTSHPLAIRLTTSSEAAARTLRGALEQSRLADWRVDVVPNRGRDLGPLLAGIGWDEVEGYDVLLHVHGKRSPHVDAEMSGRWNTFLWENLVGGHNAMADRILGAFGEDPSLGLVFPEDPHLADWDLNREHAERLVGRLGITKPLPNHFDFPVGNMFWARTDALRPFFDADFAWDEFPEEPIGIDGTMLHALERLTPFVVETGGYRSAKTAVPGVQR